MNAQISQVSLAACRQPLFKITQAQTLQSQKNENTDRFDHCGKTDYYPIRNIILYIRVTELKKLIYI